MNPADAIKASCLRETGTFVWNLRCSAELLWLSLAGEQKFKPLSSFSVAYIVLAKSQVEVKETPVCAQQRGKPHARHSPVFLPPLLLGGLIFVRFVSFDFLLFCPRIFQAIQADAKIHLYLHLNRGCNQSIASMLAGDSFVFSPKCFANFLISFVFFILFSHLTFTVSGFGRNCFPFFAILCSCQVMPWLFCLFQTSSKVRLT